MFISIEFVGFGVVSSIYERLLYNVNVYLCLKILKKKNIYILFSANMFQQTLKKGVSSKRKGEKITTHKITSSIFL